MKRWLALMLALAGVALAIVQLAEQILFGNVHSGEIVVVDVAPEGSDLPFTFTGQPKSELRPET